MLGAAMISSVQMSLLRKPKLMHFLFPFMGSETLEALAQSSWEADSRYCSADSTQRAGSCLISRESLSLSGIVRHCAGATEVTITQRPQKLRPANTHQCLTFLAWWCFPSRHAPLQACDLPL